MPRAAAYDIEADYEEEEDFLDEDTDFDDDDGDEKDGENVAPTKWSTKKGTKKKNKRAVLGESDAENTQLSAPSSGGKTIEEIYQKKSQLEHILLRPDTYSEWSKGIPPKKRWRDI